MKAKLKGALKGRLWLYLLYLAVVSLLITSVILARYATTVKGNAAASVAAWSGTTQNATVEISNISPTSGQKTYVFNVQNIKDGKISDVAQIYDLTVKTTGNLPLTYTLTGNAGTDGSIGIFNPSDGKMTAKGTNTTSIKVTGSKLPFGGATGRKHTYTLTVNWDSANKNANASQEVDLITIVVEAQQDIS